MGLLKKMIQEQKARAAELAFASEEQKPEEEQGIPLELLAGKGKHQLVLKTDETCPNCSAPMVDLMGSQLPLRVCVKCRIALPGVVPEETAAETKPTVVNSKGDVEERPVYPEEEKETVRKPVVNEQTFEDQNGEKIPTQNPQTGDNNEITEPPPPKEDEDGAVE